VRKLIFLGTAIFLGATALSFAVGLTEADFAYLATQNVERASIMLLNLSRKEQAQLHTIINYVPTTPAAQTKNVLEVLESYMERQRWERMHPGELWDLPRR
jgi:hypothetical protein